VHELDCITSFSILVTRRSFKPHRLPNSFATQQISSGISTDVHKTVSIRLQSEWKPGKREISVRHNDQVGSYRGNKGFVSLEGKPRCLWQLQQQSIK